LHQNWLDISPDFLILVGLEGAVDQSGFSKVVVKTVIRHEELKSQLVCQFNHSVLA
jgi:hypothetical protein